jgi:hypothetical protein
MPKSWYDTGAWTNGAERFFVPTYNPIPSLAKSQLSGARATVPPFVQATMEPESWLFVFPGGSIMPYAAYKDRTGERYGSLVILSYAGTRDHSRVWLCRCDCGTVKEVPWKAIQQNHTRSCGCRKGLFLRPGGYNRLSTGEAAANALFGMYKKAAGERGYDWQLSKELFIKLTSGDCFYCGCKPFKVWNGNGKRNTHGSYLYNGIDRVNNSIGYLPDNVVSCCWTCNVAKASMVQSEFYEWIERVFEFSRHRFGAKRELEQMIGPKP